MGAIWTGRPNLSGLDGLWSAPINERVAGFAALRECDPAHKDSGAAAPSRRSLFEPLRQAL